jgi:hypothetical protein
MMTGQQEPSRNRLRSPNPLRILTMPLATLVTPTTLHMTYTKFITSSPYVMILVMVSSKTFARVTLHATYRNLIGRSLLTISTTLATTLERVALFATPTSLVVTLAMPFMTLVNLFAVIPVSHGTCMTPCTVVKFICVMKVLSLSMMLSTPVMSSTTVTLTITAMPVCNLATIMDPVSLALTASSPHGIHPRP